MKDPAAVAVASRSFSRHPVLRAELLDRCADVAFNDEGKSLAGEALAAFFQGKAKVIIGLEVMDEPLLARLPALRVISKFGVGLDMIDLDSARRRGIRVAYTPGVNKRSVSELALGLMIVLLRRVVPLSAEVRGGVWKQSQGGRLSGRTVGLIGGGHIGKDLIELLAPFQCQILCSDPAPDEAFLAARGAALVSLEDLLRRSDVVSLHLPLTEATRGLMDRDRLSLMKKSAVFLNLSRGGIVDEPALREALAGGRLAGAAMDVFAKEPPDDAGLLALPNFIATPHIAGTTEESVLDLGRAAIAGLAGPP